MFIARSQEMKFLEGYYNQPGNDLIIVYGRRGIGKTELLRVFSANKPSLYYTARESSEKEQLLCMRKDWKEVYGLKGGKLSFRHLFAEALTAYSFIILDEFHLLLKSSDNFMNEMLQAMESQPADQKAMVVLISSSVNWVENEMVKTMGAAALKITAIHKIKEFSFSDIVTYFPNYSVEDCIDIYGIVGGVPGYLRYWNEERSVKENIMSLFLHKDGRFYREAGNFLKTELRELAQYNAILASLANGQNKLNEIYENTGFGRAKISVYIKNLIELDVLEKVFSYDTSGRENTKKGLYRIKDHFIHFWYCFVFPNLSRLELRKTEEIYEEKIREELSKYLSPYFVMVCEEYLTLLSEFNKLDYKIEHLSQWYGKQGTIDLIGKTTDQRYLAGACKWDIMPMDNEDFEEFLELLKLAEVEPDYYYLFSKSGFTSNLEIMAKGMNNMVLTTLEDL